MAAVARPDHSPGVAAVMSGPRTFALTLTAMVAFAANSLLCRAALRNTAIDAATFTSVRIASGAMVLWLIVRLRDPGRPPTGSWPSALALFAYAAAFSFAYLSLPAGTGALLLFGAVQATMIIAGIRAGERLGPQQSFGLACALAGLVVLVLPGLSAPPLAGSLLMLTAGMAWGIYSLRGRISGDPARATAGNFLRATPMAVAVSVALLRTARPDVAGIGYAVLSGALASGAGYAVWYTALRGLTATRAASVQLSVPVIAAAGGVALLGEPVTARLLIAAVATLGGIALVVAGTGRAR